MRLFWVRDGLVDLCDLALERWRGLAMVVFVFVGVGYNGKVRAGGFEVVGRQNIELQAPNGASGDESKGDTVGEWVVNAAVWVLGT